MVHPFKAAGYLGKMAKTAILPWGIPKILHYFAEKGSEYDFLSKLFGNIGNIFGNPDHPEMAYYHGSKTAEQARDNLLETAGISSGNLEDVVNIMALHGINRSVDQHLLEKIPGIRGLPHKFSRRGALGFLKFGASMGLHCALREYDLGDIEPLTETTKNILGIAGLSSLATASWDFIKRLLSQKTPYDEPDRRNIKIR